MKRVWEVLGHRKCSLFRVGVRVRFAALKLLLQNGEWAEHTWAEHTLQIRVVSAKVSARRPRVLVYSTYSNLGGLVESLR